MLLVTYCQPKTTIMHIVEKTLKIFTMVGLKYIKFFYLFAFAHRYISYTHQLVVTISDFGVTFYEYRLNVQDKSNNHKFDTRIQIYHWMKNNNIYF